MRKNSRKQYTSKCFVQLSRSFLFTANVSHSTPIVKKLSYHVDVGRLEQESGFFFNMKFFEEQVVAGEWEEVERYLAGFTKVDDNRYSMKIFFEIRKQKYLEALDKYVAFFPRNRLF